MQIEFHHAVTYVVSRLAGFDQKQSSVIAIAAQYVDDAVSSGVVHFSNGAVYQRISSSHEMLDLDNLKNDENLLVWLPFHFLPGNGLLEQGKNPEGTFIQKIVCRPGSFIADDMIEAAKKDQGSDRALHRLGIAMHVYADTWAHQGFAGVLHDINDIQDIDEENSSGVFPEGIGNFISKITSEATPPIGHGKANVLPDLPFLKWSYMDYNDEPVRRDNTEFFLEAVRNMFKKLYEYLNPGAAVPGFPAADLKAIESLFTRLTFPDGEKRHQEWIKAIRNNTFSFGPETVLYADRGKNSWKALALETSSDLPVHKYKDAFLTSDWKLFHDALQAHRLALLHDILPRYGICAG